MPRPTPRSKTLIRAGLTKPIVYSARQCRLQPEGYVERHPQGIGWTIFLRHADSSIHTAHGHYWTKPDAQDALQSALAAIRDGTFNFPSTQASA